MEEVTDEVEDGVVVSEVTVDVREDVVVVEIILVVLTLDIGDDVDIARAVDELPEHEIATSSLCAQL